MRKQIKRSLGMQNVITVEATPNREGNRGDEKLIEIIKPFALELKEKLMGTPLSKLVGNVIVNWNKNLVYISFILLGLLHISAICSLRSTILST